MSGELDGVYARLRAQWETDPDKVEQDVPLLARAFRETNPEEIGQLRRAAIRTEANQAAVLKAKDDVIAGLRAQNKQVREELDYQTRFSAKELVALEEKVAELQRELAPAQRVQVEPTERERLAGLGWRKGV